MYLRPIDLTTALRPSLSPDETLLFVQDAVGLYRGKFKLPDYQNGHAYLTSHRACYVDNEDPRAKAVAVHLKDVERSDIYAGFMKSSPKITLYPKATRYAPVASWSAGGNPIDHPNSFAPGDRGSSHKPPPVPASTQNATWICPICSFANPVPPNFDPSLANESTPLEPCLTCGIKPPFTLIVKAAIAGLSNRQAHTRNHIGNGVHDPTSAPASSTTIRNGSDGPRRQCPRCTFLNHPSLTSCEICHATLVANFPPQDGYPSNNSPARIDSPGPSYGQGINDADPTESIKFSFRAGGEKGFNEQLKGALVQRKWLLQGAPPTPRHDTSGEVGRDGSSPRPQSLQKGVGISGLERRDMELRKNNETVIGNAFEDLSALMASAKEIIALAENFAKQTKSSSLDVQDPSSPSSTTDTVSLLSQLNLTTTKDMLGDSSSSGTSLYLTQLARQIAEFLIDDTSGVGVLKSAGGIISQVDLWAVFNRARGGVELVSPTDFTQATELFEKLKLPVRLRRFKKSGLLVVQGTDRTDEKTIKAILDWLKDIRQSQAFALTETQDSGLEIWGRGLTALDVAEHFGWSVGVATEELEMAEERGALCREVAVEGVKFWENWLVATEGDLLQLFESASS